MREITPAQKKPLWKKTSYANLVQYVPSATYFARFRIGGKLIRQSLKTDRLSVATLRLADLQKSERQVSEVNDLVRAGKVNMEAAAEVLKNRFKGDTKLKPRSKDYYADCLAGLFRSVLSETKPR